MKLYISGKISGTDLTETRKRFAAVAKELQEQGHTTINPFENGLSENDSWENHIVRGIADLLHCKAIYMLRDWEESKGARIEQAIALELELLIMYE